MSISLDDDAEEETQLIEILDIELGVQALNNVLKETRTRAGEHHVIHIQEEVGDVIAAAKDKQR